MESAGKSQAKECFFDESKEEIDPIEEEIQNELDEDHKQQQKSNSKRSWILFCVTIVGYLIVLLWILTKVESRSIGVVILLLFLMTRENRSKAIEIFNIVQNQGLILATMCKKMGITELERDFKRSKEIINEEAIRSIIQIWIEYAILGTILFFYLLK